MLFLTAPVDQTLHSFVLHAEVSAPDNVCDKPADSSFVITRPRLHVAPISKETVACETGSQIAMEAEYKRLRRELFYSLACCVGCCSLAYLFNWLSLNSACMFFAGELVATCMALRIVSALNRIRENE